MSIGKSVVIFAAGACVGALVMYVRKERQIKDMIEEFEESLDEAYAERNGTDEVAKALNELKESTEQAARSFRDISNKEGYSNIFDVYGDEEAEDEDDEDVPEEEKESPYERPDPAPEPYHITMDEFVTNEAFDKQSLMYYSSVDLLVQDEDILDEVDSVVGKDLKEYFEDNHMTNVVYVRNERLGTDFEILLDTSEEETVKDMLGFSDDE